MSRCNATAVSETTIFPFSSICLCVMEAAHTTARRAAHMQDAKIRVPPTVCRAPEAPPPGQSRGGARPGAKALPCAPAPGDAAARQRCRRRHGHGKQPSGLPRAARSGGGGRVLGSRQTRIPASRYLPGVPAHSRLLPLRARGCQGREHPVCHC